MRRRRMGIVFDLTPDMLFRLSDGTTVTLARGKDPIRPGVPLPSGMCVTLSTLSDNVEPFPCAILPAGGPATQAVHACAALLPDSDRSHRPEVCTDVYAIEDAPQIHFSATVGDETASNRTFCTISKGINDSDPSCSTPASFFLEQPTASVSLVFTKTKNESGQLRGDLHIDGRLKESDTDAKTVVVSSDL